MWRMLCKRGLDLELTHSDVQADDERGSARWAADYTLSGTGRAVHNEIEASFRFRDGLIAEHVDRFDLWRWSRQALGLRRSLYDAFAAHHGGEYEALLADPSPNSDPSGQLPALGPGVSTPRAVGTRSRGAKR